MTLYRYTNVRLIISKGSSHSQTVSVTTLYRDCLGYNMEAEDKKEKDGFTWRGGTSDQAISSRKALRLHRLCQQRLEIAVNTS